MEPAGGAADIPTAGGGGSDATGAGTASNETSGGGGAAAGGVGGEAPSLEAGAGGGPTEEVREPNLLFKSLPPAGAYEVKYNGVPLADANARFTELGSEGYVVTTGEAFSILGDTSIRYVAFKPEGSTVKYEVKYSGVPLADANARFTELGSEGYVVTTGEAFSILGDTSIRYVAFKPLSLP
jgi:hypothetical protein